MPGLHGDLQNIADCEFIEAEATGYTQEQINFYEKNGLNDVGIDIDDGHRMVMAWHNPRFKQQAIALDELVMRKTWGTLKCKQNFSKCPLPSQSLSSDIPTRISRAIAYCLNGIDTAVVLLEV